MTILTCHPCTSLLIPLMTTTVPLPQTAILGWLMDKLNGIADDHKFLLILPQRSTCYLLANNIILKRKGRKMRFCSESVLKEVFRKMRRNIPLSTSAQKTEIMNFKEHKGNQQ